MRTKAPRLRPLLCESITAVGYLIRALSVPSGCPAPLQGSRKPTRRPASLWLGIAAVLAGAIALALVAGSRSGAVAGSPRRSHAANGLSAAKSVPAGLAQALRDRFGSRPIGLRSAPLVSGIAADAHGWKVKAPDQSLSAQISSDGAVSAHLDGSASVELRLVGLASGSRRAPVSGRAASLSGGRLSEHLGVVRADDAVTRGGLEQRYTIGHALSDASTLTLSFSSSARWRTIRGGSAIMPAETGTGRLAYAGLRVTDARGRVLASHFAPGPDGPKIVVDTGRAVYPVTVDPTWTTTSTPTATLTDGEHSKDYFGVSVALSADGTTALVGAVGVDNDAGAAYVYHVSTAGSWATSAEPTATLTDSSADYFGYAVALSADGTTALVGAYETEGGAGAAYVYHVSSESSWSSSASPAATLSNSADPSGHLGYAVALSADGTTALLGEAGTSGKGAAVVYHAASETSWSSATSPAATLSDSSASDFGCAVALSEDGTTALVGAYGAGDGAGAAYVFHVSSAASWSSSSSPAAALSNATSSQYDFAGYSVALSADGTTALLGTYESEGPRGEAYLFHVASPTSWSSSSSPTATLTDSASTSGYDFGYSVALSAGGTTALIDAPAVDTGGDIPAAYVYQVASEDSWSTTSTPTAALSHDEYSSGTSVALAADAATAVVGLAHEENNVGAAFVFSATSMPPSQETLTVAPAGSGSGTVTSSPAGIDCGGTCAAQFEQDTEVTLTATAAAGSTFAGWSGGGCSGSGTCTVTMSAAAAVTATFETSSGGTSTTGTTTAEGTGTTTTATTTATTTSNGGGQPTASVAAELLRLNVTPGTSSLAGRIVNGSCAAVTKKNKTNRHCTRVLKLTIGYTLSSAAAVKLTFARRAAGREVGGQCVAPTKRTQRKRGCWRYVGISGSLLQSAAAGYNSDVFNGKLGGRPLGSGTFQLTATPAGGEPQTANFTILS